MATARARAPAVRSIKPVKPSGPPSRVKPRTKTAPLLNIGPALRLKDTLHSSTHAGLPTGGQSMVPATHAAIENSLHVDLKGVRVHSDTRAQSAARNLSARAFTYGNQIFLGTGQQQSDVELMAHETAHVVQQQSAPVLQRFAAAGPMDTFEREANKASAAVMRGETFRVQQRTAGHSVQRFGISDALDFFADKANFVPGFRLLTIVLGFNPINGNQVARSGANILRGLVELLPGGGLITEALNNSGIFDKVGVWVEHQFVALGEIGGAIKQSLHTFLNSLGLSDILNLGDVWSRAKRIFTGPIGQLIEFGKGLVSDIVKFVKAAILRPLGKMAEKTAGYDLVKAVLEEDPVTGDHFPRTPETLIGGFMKLIGQEEVWENIKKSNAVPRAWTWFQGAMSGLIGFVSQLPTRFVNAFTSLELFDIVLVPRAFAKIASVFGGFMSDFLSWAGKAVWNLLQIIFEVVAPGAVPYLSKVGGAFKTILKYPIAFVGNLVKAGTLGFQTFADNIGKHLKAALINWLTGSLEGVYIPKALEFREILKFASSVLGLTWANIRVKLVKVLGESPVKVLETGFKLVSTLVTEGPAAAWEEIKKEIGNLKDMVMGAIMDFVIVTVVKKAVAKIISFLIPGGAFIQAIVTIYDTILVFISRLKTIMQVAVAFLDSVVAIAAGAIGGAAKKVESVLAGILVLAISFLAGFAGLGKIANKVMEIIKTKVRAPIDKALDKLIAFIVKAAKGTVNFVSSGVKSAAGFLFEWWKNKVSFSDKKGKSHKLFFSGQGENARLKVASTELFTEEFIGRIEKEFADPNIRDFGLKFLDRCKQQKREIDKLKPMLERAIKAKSPQAEAIDQKLKNAMNQLALNMGPLFDILPENMAAGLPVKRGDFVTLRYKSAVRKAEILVASMERIHCRIPSVSPPPLLQFLTAIFLQKWKANEIRPYVEGGARDMYLGATPGKSSSTGRVVTTRYKTKVSDKNEVLIEWESDKWWPLPACDMSHFPVDAVDYWNEEALPNGYAPKGPEVRRWMLDPKNYIIEPAHINRSRGSKNKSKYKAPPP